MDKTSTKPLIVIHLYSYWENSPDVDWAKSPGFKPYQLSNNNAESCRLRSRETILEACRIRSGANYASKTQVKAPFVNTFFAPVRSSNTLQVKLPLMIMELFR